MHPLVSIIVPVYNIEKYLPACLDSILRQEYRNYEVILVDDGSSDSSGSIIDDYCLKNEHFIAIHKKNGGQSSARNAALDIASGEFLGFVDGDDWIDEKMISTLVQSAQNLHADISACNMYLMKRSGKMSLYTKYAHNTCFSKTEAMAELPSNRILTFSPCNKIYRSHLFNGLRFKEGIIFEDMDLSYKIFQRANKAYYTNTPLYYYRFNDMSTLRKKFTIARLDEYFVKKEMHEFYKLNYPKISNITYHNLFQCGTDLFLNIKQHIHDSLDEYSYLLQYDRTILKKLLKDTIPIKSKFFILLFLLSPNVAISTKKLYRSLKLMVSKMIARDRRCSI